MKKLSILTLITLCATPALANNTIFSCTTTENQLLSVNKSGKDYVFSYKGVKFTNPVKQVMSNERSFIAEGSGFITSSLELKNEGKSYLIELSQPRNNPSEIDDVVISINDSQIIYCDTNKKITQNIEKKLMKKP